MLQRVILIIGAILICLQAFAQVEDNSLRVNYDDEIYIDNDSIVPDSSYLALSEFRRDSLMAREQFIKDSLYRRQQILDSVMFLQEELPKLLNAAIKATSQEIVMSNDPVEIIGDSMLTNFTYRVLSHKISKPYAPWRTTVDLSDKEALRLEIDTIEETIKSFHIAKKSYFFNYENGENIVEMIRSSSIIKKQHGSFYKQPIYKVFFNDKGQVTKIEESFKYYEASKTYKRGKELGTDISKIKTFTYFTDGVLASYEIVGYCDRFSPKNANQKCSKKSYAITHEGRKFTILETNEPKNQFSDFKFIYEFDKNFDLKSMESIGESKELNQTSYVELNEDGYVKRYLYKKDGKIRRTLLINYNNDPNASYKYETITCLFKDDRVCYYQKNNRTGKIRIRDKLTLKWSDWKKEGEFR